MKLFSFFRLSSPVHAGHPHHGGPSSGRPLLLLALALSLITSLAASTASAQHQGPGGPRKPGAAARGAVPDVPPAPPPVAAGDTGSKPQLLDRIVMIINDEAITQHDLDEQKAAVLQRMKASNVTPPPDKELEHQIIERMITEKTLLQYAKETGVRVDDTMIERTITRVSQDNKMTVDELRQALQKEGLPFSVYREELRKQIIVQRLREREVDSKIVVTDAEVNSYLDMVNAQAGGEAEYLVSHILVRVPDQATPDVIDARQARANEIRKKLTDGADFAQTAATMSDASDALSGGSLGWRTPARLPALFADTLHNLKKGQISNVLRSPAGFHILQLNDLRSRSAPKMVEQTHARHILVRVSETTSDEDAKQKILRAQQRIKDGETFETVARLMSEDASSSRGGDLSWINPGDTVPDFERAMEALGPNQMSEPVRTQFGWHIIQVLERREQDVTEERQREQARQALRQRKSDEAFEDFLRQQRDRAYVEYKTSER